MLNSVQMAFAVSLVASALGVLCKLASRYGARAEGLPPGPPTVPWLGNLLDMPTSAPHVLFTALADKYGEIFSLQLAHIPAVVLSSCAAIEEVLDKNAAATADRPANYVVDVVCEGKHVALTRNSQTWRSLRRGVHGLLTQRLHREYLVVQHAESLQLTYDFLTQPENFLRSIRRLSFSVISSILYGKRVATCDSPEYSTFFGMLDLWIRLITPGAVPPLDFFPILKYIPSYFAPWKRLVQQVRTAQHAVYFGMLDDFKERLDEGRGNNGYLGSVLDNAEPWGLNDELTAHLGGALMEGGSDTTAAFLQSFVLLLVAHPEVQAKAQREIDEVVGTEEMPTLDDFARLPYLRAVVSETHRFRPIAPLAIPHAATADVQYGQYVIPKGSIVFANVWAVLHDKSVFEHPDVFDPERFIKDPDSAKVTDLIFGTGRRACPGIHLAKNTVAINAMNLVWGFDLKKPLDEHGNIVELDISDYVHDLASHPHPYKCRIEPRSKERADIIREEYADVCASLRVFE